MPERDAKCVLAALPASGCEILHVSESVFEKLAFGQRTEGVLGVAETPRRTSGIASAGRRVASAGWGGSSTATPTQDSTATPTQRSTATPTKAAPLVAVLEGVEKPGNVGAVLRSADAAGVSAVIVADPRTDLYNPNAIRASLGTIFTMPVCEAESGEAIAWLRQQKFTHFCGPGRRRRALYSRPTTAARRRLSWAARRPACRMFGPARTLRPFACRCWARPTV